jgi:hypothetical protein
MNALKIKIVDLVINEFTNSNVNLLLNIKIYLEQFRVMLETD